MDITCPACRKVNQPPGGLEAACTRCGCDLSSLVAIARAAGAQLQDAGDALRAGYAGVALAHADRSWRLRRSRPAAAAAALAAAASGDSIALDRWHRRWAETDT